ncbi:glutathione S-transferase N-terminal domain-containing protein [Halioglobus pacificus]|uniref:Glutathione S-transferase n=1 Tax=Parahalioglobus pacificus TaxID=930806 RepID=A0A919CH77_9GAMM|nr:glutathione S-transferase N-terminal domain-containing protein [Halioglobus pacificus]GHD25284.1 glutathione S-transferase [Halioglobus pacificus]
MVVQDRIHLLGNTPSPYTQKMVSLLRYRRLPYKVTWTDVRQYLEANGIEAPRPVLLPTFLYEEDGDTKARCDSTPIIADLDALYPERKVLPSDPALAFIDFLLEDFADEWVTKYMFHYRWYPEADADNAGSILPVGMDVTLADKDWQHFKAFFTERQVSRLYVVGSNDTTAPVIDASYRRFLSAMETHLSQQPFMLGRRPGSSDFGLFGQLTQLVGFDPTPRAIAHEISPRTVAWVDLVRDLSGLEPTDSDWIALEEQPDSLKGLLAEIGRVYVPAQLANAKALAAGEKSWDAEIDGQPWTQPAFPYQGKCLRWTNERYQALSTADRERVDAVLAGTGVEAMLSAD